MDRPLSSNREREDRGGRYDSGYRGRGYGGRGRGYRGGFRGRGRGRGRRGGGDYHSRGGGDYHPYNQGGGGRHRGERPSNRFYAEPQHNDPRTTLLKQLNELLHQVGQLPDPTNSNPDGAKTAGSQRWVVQTMSKNVASLSSVLCAKSHLFLQSEPNSADASIVAGPLAAGLVQAAAVGPLQTPCYAALALAVQQQDTIMNILSPAQTDGDEMIETSEFAQRTVQYATRLLARDLDTMLLMKAPSQEQPPPDFRNRERNNGDSAEPLARIVLRIRLVLRYLGLLCQLGIVARQAGDDPNLESSDSSFDPVVSSTNHQPVGFHGLLQTLVQAARLLMQGGGGVTDDATNPDLSILLAFIVYSTIPYLAIHQQGESPTPLPIFWQEQIVQPLQPILDTYRSDFEPGIGPKSILLKYEQFDRVGSQAEEDEDDDEEDEEYAGTASQVCDSFQDLRRCVDSIMAAIAGDKERESYRFALFTDAPWEALMKPRGGEQASAMEREGQETSAESSEREGDERLSYTGVPICLSLFPESVAITMIIGGPVAVGVISGTPHLKMSRIDFQGVIVGRLPIFGSPRDPDDDDEEENMEDEGPTNERLETYSKTYGLVDRYFLGEAVRDCLLSHEPKVSDTGVERGNAKAVAGQIWSIRQLVLDASSSQENVDDSTPIESNIGAVKRSVGIEYVLVEVVLSLIVQASNRSDFLGLTYLSKVLLELVKLEPATITAATVQAVSTLVEDYMPALVPLARYNLSRWFAFHLIHSNYKWPEGYWNHWEPHVGSDWGNSRGAFVRDTVSIMMENLSDPTTELLPHLPVNLWKALVLQDIEDDKPAMSDLGKDLERRIWDMDEDPSMILPHMVGSELEESFASENISDSMMWRTKVVTRALLAPALRERGSLQNALVKHIEAGGDEAGGMIEQEGMNTGNDFDSLAQIKDALQRYRPLLEGVIAKDTEAINKEELDMSEIKFHSEGVMLAQAHEVCSFSETLFSTIVNMLVEMDMLSTLGLLRWCLGGYNETIATSRWWELGEAAVRKGASRLLASGAAADSGYMEMDDDVETTTKPRNVRTAEAFIRFSSPILKLIVERTNSVIVSHSNEMEGQPAKKLPSSHILAIEGCKILVRACRELFFSGMFVAGLSDSSDDFSEILGVYNSSEITGSSLAQLCGVSGTLSSKVLLQSLERM